MNNNYKLLIFISFSILISLVGCGDNNAAKLLGDTSLLTQKSSSPTITPQPIELPYPITDQDYNQIFFDLRSKNLLPDRTTINDLRNLTSSSTGFGDPCTRNSTPTKKIYGVVTYRPNHYSKMSLCGGGAEKYYGGFWIQDNTAGIYVLHDGKSIPFNVGDLISIEVESTKEFFSKKQVLTYKNISRIKDSSNNMISLKSLNPPTGALYAVSITDMNQVEHNYGRVVTFDDLTIVESPSNANFNTICAHITGTPQDCSKRRYGKNHVKISLDNKWLQGNPFDKPFAQGQKIKVSGPIEIAYGEPTIAVTSNDQIHFID